MILLIDNYDSFSYNLYQLIGSIDDRIKVIRNDEMTLEEIEKLNPEFIFISPGPGRPENAGICIEAVKYFAGKIPIMGVCLGHQVICEAFGATVSYAKELLHGKTSMAYIDNSSIVFKGMEEKTKVARYHSLAALRETIPECLKITAETEDGEIMAIEHREYPVYGLQFHPESVMTEEGYKMIKNFISVGEDSHLYR